MKEKFVLCICAHNGSFEGREREHVRCKGAMRMRGSSSLFVIISSGLQSQQLQQPCSPGDVVMRCQDLRQSCAPVEPRDPARCPMMHVPSPQQRRGLSTSNPKSGPGRARPSTPHVNGGLSATVASYSCKRSSTTVHTLCLRRLPVYTTRQAVMILHHVQTCMRHCSGSVFFVVLTSFFFFFIRSHSRY